MTASIIDGKALASTIQKKIKQTVTELTQQGYMPPGLAVILVGDAPASAIYVKNKRASCAYVGFNSYAYNLPADTTQIELLALINKLNNDASVDGILIQLPLPSHCDTNTIIESINPDKDVDGFHPYNFGKLAQGNPTLRPCTPYGVMTLLENYKIPVLGKNAVIIGSSNIVGRPMALELLRQKATVTICHRATNNLEHHVRYADILILSAGSPNVVPVAWLHKNQVVIDIGINRRTDGTICGDIDFVAACKKVAWITPVPGGVGPMTISMLLQNTLLAATKLRHYPLSIISQSNSSSSSPS